jgi:hypothetical protein
VVIALLGADLFGITAASFILDVIYRAAPNDADLTIDPPARQRRGTGWWLLAQRRSGR